MAAGRFSLGSVFGSSTADIPADKRFYAGGGGSIRGYGFQDVGPRDAEGEPTGGRSLIEVGAEMRVKVTDTIGIVPFIDGGNVYELADAGLFGRTALGRRHRGAVLYGVRAVAGRCRGAAEQAAGRFELAALYQHRAGVLTGRLRTFASGGVVEAGSLAAVNHW